MMPDILETRRGGSTVMQLSFSGHLPCMLPVTWVNAQYFCVRLYFITVYMCIGDLVLPRQYFVS